MKIVVGLGNPGKKYQNTRHNVGFMVLDQSAKKSRISFRPHKQSLAEVGEYVPAAPLQKILLAKAQAFMNNSGQPVRGLLSYYKLDPGSLLVIYDDVDLDFGKVRSRLGGGSAGHNGVRSVINAIGPEFWRLRIGIKNPHLAKTDTNRFVLSPFNRVEKETLSQVFDYADQQILKFAQGPLAENTQSFPINK